MLSVDTAEQDVNIFRFKNNDSAEYIQRTISTPGAPLYFGTSYWGDYWTPAKGPIPSVSDKFVGYSMSFMVEGESGMGALEIVSLDVFGMIETGV